MSGERNLCVAEEQLTDVKNHKSKLYSLKHAQIKNQKKMPRGRDMVEEETSHKL